MTLYQYALELVHKNEPISANDLRTLLRPFCEDEETIVETIDRMLNSTVLERVDGMLQIRRV